MSTNINKRLAMKTIIILILFQLLTRGEADNPSKRVPSGFQGMRGKKSVEYVDSDESRFLEKRRMQGFVGVKGKKDSPIADAKNMFLYKNEFGYLKRAPMGFMGMRGKKTFQDEQENEQSVIRDFQILKNLLKVYHEDSGTKSQDGPDDDNRYWDDVLNQRTDSPTDDESNLSNPDNKDDMTTEIDIFADKYPTDDFLTPGHSKRTSKSGFFGMRGKKVPDPYFGLRGKKGPFGYPFHGKFVGVRGKKASEGLNNFMDFLNKDGYWAKRRGPSGFVGMRGKKWAKSDSEAVEDTLVM